MGCVWQVYLGGPDTETGSNTGSNFSIARFNDAGTYVNDAVKINRSSGDVAFTTNLISLVGTSGSSIQLTDVGPSSVLFLNKISAGGFNQISGATAGVTRWQLNLGNTSGNFEISLTR